MPDIISQQKVVFEAKGKCLDRFFGCLCGSASYVLFLSFPYQLLL